MKIVKLIIIILLTQLSPTKAAGQGVDYFNKGDIYQALQIAQQKQQFLLVEVHAPWNSKSQWQNKILNQDSTLCKYINNNFVTYKFNTQNKKGADFANQYSVTDYPCIFVFNTNGDVINKIDKAYDPKNLIEKLEKIQLSIQGSKMWRISQIETQLKQQQITKAQQLTDQLIVDLKEKIIAIPYWETLSNTTLNYYLSPAYRTLTENRKLANNAFGETEMKSLLTEIINNEIMTMLTNPKNYDSLKITYINNDIRKLGLNKPELSLKIGMIIDLANNNITGYIQKCGELANVVDEDKIFNTVLTLSAIVDNATSEERQKARQIVRRQMRQIAIHSQTLSLTALLKGLDKESQ